MDRDGNRSRWPGDDSPTRLEAAHYRGKGIGGDKDGTRSAVNNLITFSFDVHQGTRSIHSGHLKVEPLDLELLMDGPCEFYRRESVLFSYGPWRLVGREIAVGVLEPSW